jgi:hypothetical protein
VIHAANRTQAPRPTRPRPLRLAPALSLALSALGCAHQAPPPSLTVAVLAFDSVGVAAPEVEKLRADLARRIASFAGTRVLPDGAVRSAAAETAECRSPAPGSGPACGTRLGRRLEATHVVAGAVGGLGMTRVLQLTLVTVREGVVTRTLEETVLGGARVDTRLAEIAERLLGVTSRPPWYSRWWLWTLIGVGVATAVALPVALIHKDPYEEIRLP